MAVTNRRQHSYNAEGRGSPIISSDYSVHTEGPSSGRGVELEEMQVTLEKSDVPHMLMSPPPEEVLRTTRGKHASDARLSATRSAPDGSFLFNQQQTPHASKRKRVASLAIAGHSDLVLDDPPASSSSMMMDVTPDPKARKHARKHVSFVSGATTPVRSPSKSRKSVSPKKRNLLESPHTSNPRADYIPPSPSAPRRKRHSVAPIPAYEPPPEQFTPPREIIYTPVPSMSKSSKRKSLGRSPVKSSSKKGKLVLQIKKEPPDIDLNEPLPPASPSDDPLLLRGHPRSHKKPKRRSSQMIYARDTPPISSSSPIRAPSNESRLVDMEFSSLNFDTDDDDGPLPAVFNFDVDHGAADDWTDDEPQSDFDHTGEYTGKFKQVLVPTKVDPPSSCTQARQDAWGHPVSPYPRKRQFSPVPESPEAAGYQDDFSENRTVHTPEPESPTLRLTVRSTQAILPSTPGDILIGSPPSDDLPPSSPPRYDLHETSEDAGEWREPPGIPSEDQHVEEIHIEGPLFSINAINVDIGSDLPATECGEPAPFPPDTPYSELVDTPKPPLSQSSVQTAAPSSPEDAMEIVPIQVQTEEMEMDVDTPPERPPESEPHQLLDSQEEWLNDQETPIAQRDYSTPRPILKALPKPTPSLSGIEELVTPGAVFATLEPSSEPGAVPIIEAVSTPAGIGTVLSPGPDFVELESEPAPLIPNIAHADEYFAISPAAEEAPVPFSEAAAGQVVESIQRPSPPQEAFIPAIELSPQETFTPAVEPSLHEPEVAQGNLTPEDAEDLEDTETVTRVPSVYRVPDPCRS
ncbi:hypothetical protein NM688_g4130 [Phlebia brevispora]|uniref:Uncharacterized protein n=1 Tax=Phlebia brevispora TaxID=194682 RepID=A0ACC1T3I8_9APHY|nr:hypothetical protein NM688_g4130 [Phlebia brevispora]